MTNAIQMISIARSQMMGLQDEDTWRAKLFNLVGERSLRKMTDHQLQQVLTVLKNEGFQPRPSTSKRSPAETLSGRFASPVRAFWLSGYHLGVFRSRDDKAILAFARKQTGLEHVRFAMSNEHGKAIIEAIKAIVRREADLPDLWRPISGISRAHFGQDGRVQVLHAQWEILGRLGAQPTARLAHAHPGAAVAIANLDGPVLIEMQQALGKLIRDAKKKAVH